MGNCHSAHMRMKAYKSRRKHFPANANGNATSSQIPYPGPVDISMDLNIQNNCNSLYIRKSSNFFESL